MADYSLALGVRPLQLEDPLTSYSKFAAIQNAQNQNALAQYKLSAAQREDESINALRQLFSDPKNIDQTSPEFIRSVYGISPEAGIKYAKSIAEMRKEQGTFDKTESELLTAELARSRGLMGQAQTPEELASIVSNSYNPKTRTGKYFASQGLDVNTALEAIAQTKNDPQAFYTLLESFASNGDKLIENIRAKAQAFQIRPQPTIGRTSAGTPAAQENALGMRLGTPVPTPTQNALGAPAAGGVNTTAIPTAQVRPFPLSTEQPAPAGAAAAPTSFATGRLAKIEQEIDQLEDVLAQYPGNKLAADRLQLKIGIRDKLVAEVSPKPQVFDLNNQVLTIDMNPKSPTYGTELTSRIKGATPSGPSSLAVMQAERDALPPGDPRRAELDQKIKKETQTALSSLAMKQAERDALPPGDPRRDELDRAIKKETENAPSSLAVLQAEANALPVGDTRRKQIEEKIARETKESLPADVQSYEFARKQGYTGTYTQWVKDKATWGRAPATPAAPISAFDRETKQLVFVTNEERLRNPGRYAPTAEKPDRVNPNSLRDEYIALTKDFRTVQDAHTKITTTAQTGAGDMSLLYNYIKLLDPTSVVRESEFAAAAASGSFGERVQGAVNKVQTGQRLTENLRKDFINEANNLYKAQRAGAERIKNQYTEMAKRANLNPEDVIVDYSAKAAPAVPATQPAATDINLLPPKVTKNGKTYVLQTNGKYIEQ